MRHAFFAALIVAPSIALAGEVDFSRHIVDLDGKDIPTSQAKDAPPLDLAYIAGAALLTDPPPDPRAPNQGKDPNEKLKRFNLAVSVHGGKTVNLTSEQITLLKDAISVAFGPLIYGRAVEILDPAVTGAGK